MLKPRHVVLDLKFELTPKPIFSPLLINLSIEVCKSPIECTSYTSKYFLKEKEKWKCPITTVQILKGRQSSSRDPGGKSPPKETTAGKPGGGVSIGFWGFTQQEQRHSGGPEVVPGGSR